MLNAGLIQKLKQTNISVDGDKTKERVEKLWKAAAAEQKEAILELAGVITATIYRVYRTGSISTKLTVPLAQTLNVNPFYLTGHEDELGAFSDEGLRKLLLKYGYKKIVEEANLKRPYKRQQVQAEEAPAPAVPETVEVETEAVALLTPQLLPDSGALTMDDLNLLLSALTIQAKAGIASAKEKLAQIRLVLLT